MAAVHNKPLCYTTRSDVYRVKSHVWHYRLLQPRSLSALQVVLRCVTSCCCCADEWRQTQRVPTLSSLQTIPRRSSLTRPVRTSAIETCRSESTYSRSYNGRELVPFGVQTTPALCRYLVVAYKATKVQISLYRLPLDVRDKSATNA